LDREGEAAEQIGCFFFLELVLPHPLRKFTGAKLDSPCYAVIRRVVLSLQHLIDSFAVEPEKSGYVFGVDSISWPCI
jgi:hypothetical protein